MNTDKEFAKILSYHFFLTKDEGIRLQILDFFKQILDSSLNES